MDGARQSFCALLFLSNGGQFFRGRPVLQGERGNCDVASDCGCCSILVRWVEEQIRDGWSADWQCSVCISELRKIDREHKKSGGRVVFPGYYQAGGPEEALSGCTMCGRESPLLQLVLRK